MSLRGIAEFLGTARRRALDENPRRALRADDGTVIEVAPDGSISLHGSRAPDIFRLFGDVLAES